MGRFQEFMNKVERGEEEVSPTDQSAEQEERLNRQKEADLVRAQARSVNRPIKKELRHSRIEGRYIRPEEIKKEVEKLEAAKREAVRKKGFFNRFFGKKKIHLEKEECGENIISAASAGNRKTEGGEDENAEKKQKAEQIKRLRGITPAKKNRSSQETENRFLSVNGLLDSSVQNDIVEQQKDDYDFVPQETDFPSQQEKRFSFMESVRRINADREQEFFTPAAEPEEQEESFPNPADMIEMSRLLFAPLPPDRPDGIIATALSTAVGFVYWDEEGQKADRIITIRKLFYRQGDILIDAYCHDIKAPRLIAFSRGIKMYNLQTMQPYDNPRDFLLHHITGLTENEKFETSGFTAALSIVRYELTALIFVAKSDFNRSDEENKLMLSYISQRCPTIDFDEKEMLDYIAILVPDEQSFSEALEIVVKQQQDIVFLFVRTFLQMMLSDGVLHENERELLAELLFLLQTEGIELNRIGFG